MDETTLFFAKLASAYYWVTGLGFLLSTDFYAKMVSENKYTDPVALNLSGAIHFLVGLSILIQHFRWSSFPEAVITIIGIVAVVKGVGLIVVPAWMLQSPKSNETALKISGVGFLAIGAYLGFIGYVR